MTATITDVYHNGTSWVANVVTSEGKVVDLSITDAQADKLKEAGVEVYGGSED